MPIRPTVSAPACSGSTFARALTGRFPIPDDGAPHGLGDLVIARAGDAYASDSRGPGIYRVPAGADSLERFVTSPLLLSAQGLAFDAAERTLYVADYSRGILRVDLATREVRLLDAARTCMALGIDGLYPVRGGLVGIQNGVDPARVVRLRLSRAASGSTRWKCWSARGRTTPSRRSASSWTRAVLCGQQPVGALREDGGIDAPDRLQPPLVLRLRL